jgi:hypothetical protein
MGVNKGLKLAVIEAVKKNPGAGPGEIQRILQARGIESSSGYVSQTKREFLASGGKVPTKAEGSRPAATSNGKAAALSLADLQLAAEAVKILGGRNRLREAVDILEGLAGEE